MMNIPNALTLGRILVIPIFIGAFYLAEPTAAWITFALFAAAALTDFFDGWLARRLDQQSDIGRIFDPIADKLLVAAALVMLVALDRAAAIPVVAILCREVLVSGLREGLAGRFTIAASKLAKWKTASQMGAISVLLIAPALSAQAAIATAGTVLLWVAVALTWITGLDYLRVAMKQLQRSTERAG